MSENEERRAKSKELYPFLDPEFLDLMNQIGKYGHDKYHEVSFHAMAERGDFSRPSPRHMKEQIIQHGQEHGNSYLRGELHDKFGTSAHQLAAMAFNPMMEFHFSRGDEKYTCPAA